MPEAELKITVLSENTVGAPAGLTGEWGLAMLVEWAGKKILFDTGERGALVENAAALGVDLQSVDALVISHGHYDHTGGCAPFCAGGGGCLSTPTPVSLPRTMAPCPGNITSACLFAGRNWKAWGRILFSGKSPGKLPPAS
ncbi:MAG: MBL fold metallo-hydrolase [Bacillota bacterium]